MKNIKDLINGESPLNDSQIMSVFNEIGAAGDIIILKNDGPRSDRKFTIAITSGSGKFDSIRYDSNDLSEGIRKVLGIYDRVRGV